jgi:hypothetical protein
MKKIISPLTAPLFLVPLIFAILSIFIGQDSGWDFRNYHLYNGYAFLNHRLDIDLAPAGMQTYFNPVIDIFYFLTISHFSPIIATFIIGFLQGLNFIWLFFIGRQVFNLSNGYLLTLASLGMLSIWFLSGISLTMQDSLLANFPLLSLLLILSTTEIINEKLNNTVLLKIAAAGFLAGFACGLKLVMATYALALCLSFFVLSTDWITRLKLATFFGIAVLFGLATSGGYWFYEVWAYSGNPLFPQFNTIFHSELTPITQSIVDTRFLPRNIKEKLFYPLFFTAGPWKIDTKLINIGWVIAYGIILLLLIKQLLFKITKRKLLTINQLFIISFFVITYILWQIIFSIFRYLITIELLIPIVFMISMFAIFPSKNTNRISLLILGFVMLINLYVAMPKLAHRTPWTEPVFQVNMPELKNIEPKAVFFAAQPLAWIIPILDTQAPYIQITPNFPTSNTYWSKAKDILANRNGKMYFIYEIELSDSQLPSSTLTLKNNLNLVVNMESCKVADASISSKSFKYGYCEINS